MARRKKKNHLLKVVLCFFIAALLLLTATVVLFIKINNTEIGVSSDNSYIQVSSESSSAAESSNVSSAQQVSSAVTSSTAPKPINIPEIPKETLARITALSNEKDGWGQGTHKDSLNRPTGSLSAQKKYGKYDAKFIMENEKKIYLTFDEGYENGYTDDILDVLKEKDVKAVFFVTLSYAKSNPKLIRRMIDEGHIVGNHSSKHFSYPESDLQTVYEDFIGLHNYIVENFNYEMKLFRFPMGEYSERTLALVQELGYESLFWSYAYKDWEPKEQPTKEEAFNKITSNAHPGALYLLHAVSKTNTEVLGSVIDKFRADGYSVELYPVK